MTGHRDMLETGRLEIVEMGRRRQFSVRAVGTSALVPAMVVSGKPVTASGRMEIVTTTGRRIVVDVGVDVGALGRVWICWNGADAKPSVAARPRTSAALGATRSSRPSVRKPPNQAAVFTGRLPLSAARREWRSACVRGPALPCRGRSPEEGGGCRAAGHFVVVHRFPMTDTAGPRESGQRHDDNAARPRARSRRRTSAAHFSPNRAKSIHCRGAGLAALQHPGR
jgi:hypothetical protein